MKNVSKYIDFARVIRIGHKVKTVNVIGIPNIIASAQISTITSTARNLRDVLSL